MAIAAEAGATPAEVALAWLLANDDEIVPTPSLANHMGPPMVHLLERMGVKVLLGATHGAREAAMETIDNRAASTRK